MQPYDIIRQKRRFEMFSDKTKFKVLELNTFFGKYNMHFDERIKKTFTYYDTPNNDLLKSNIVLFKTQIGDFCELNMATEKANTAYRYAVRTNYKHFTEHMRAHESILKHKQFLIENFKNMFLSSVGFDPEFMMKRLEVAYTITTTSEEYRSSNLTGLKITYSFDKDVYYNTQTKQRTTANILTIYQHSSPNSDEAFEDLIGKLGRYLKELTPTTETKIMIARRLTNKSIIEKNKAISDKLKDNAQKIKEAKQKQKK